MSRFQRQPANKLFVQHGGRRRAVETRYGVRLNDVRGLISTGPANLMLWGDSISSVQAGPRLPVGIAHEWKAPNGIAGWFVPVAQASAGTLTSFDTSQNDSTSLPFAGNTVATGANCTKTAFADSNLFITDQVLTGVVSVQPRPSNKYAFTGAPDYQEFHSFNVGPMGLCQAHASVWAAGDWLTGKTTIRVGMCHMAHANSVTANMTIFSQEGVGNASGAAAGVVINSITTTTPATPTTEIAWATLAASSVDTPFGTVENAPGRTQNPLNFQYEGVGSVVPGTSMTAAQLVAAGNANWSGAIRFRPLYNSNATSQNGKSIICYGTVIEDTANTTGLYVDNLSYSGDTILTQVDGSTVAQMAAALTTNAQRKINWVLMQIGENHTTAEWAGGSISSSQIRTDLLLRIARLNAGWDLAGIPRGKITLVSPWESVGGTKSGSAWYTTLASIMRDLALSSEQISFIDLRQMFADRFSSEILYHASRNQYMNILQDGVHPSYIGTRLQARFMWQAIMGTINE